MKFYVCEECEQLVFELFEHNGKLFNCEKEMKEIEPIMNSNEKDYILSVDKIGNFVKVKIGDYPHRMIDIHHIKVVILETSSGFQCKYIKDYKRPIVDFMVDDNEKVLNVYAYCNIHLLFGKSM